MKDDSNSFVDGAKVKRCNPLIYLTRKAFRPYLNAFIIVQKGLPEGFPGEDFPGKVGV